MKAASESGADGEREKGGEGRGRAGLERGRVHESVHSEGRREVGGRKRRWGEVIKAANQSATRS